MSFKSALKNMTDARLKHGWKDKLDSGGGTGGDNVITGYVSDKGRVLTCTYPCHNPIHQFQNASVLWSAFGYRTEKNVAETYHNWLCHNSPWAMNGIVPNQSDEETFNIGFIFDKLDKHPANLLHNFLIATRMNAEWPLLIDTWYRLVTEHGVDPTFAFLMLTVFLPYQSAGKSFLDTKGCFAVTDKYDWPLDMARATEEYVLNFCHGDAVGKSTYAFYPLAQTAPVNTLWGSLLPLNNKGTYISKLKSLYKPNEMKETMSALSMKTITTELFKSDRIINIIQNEQARLGL